MWTETGLRRLKAPARRQAGIARILLSAGILFVFTGCGRVGEKTINEVLERDPGFRKIYGEKQRIREKIADLKSGYLKEKDRTSGKIRELKENLALKKQNFRSQSVSLGREMEPKIVGLQSELKAKKEEFKVKKRELAEASSKLTSIGKFLEKKGEFSLTADEIAIWNDRTDSLKKEITSLRKDLDTIEGKIHLLKTEIRILKQ